MLLFCLMIKRHLYLSIPLALILSLISACQSAPEIPPMVITVVADGRSYIYNTTEPLSVGEFLREVEVELGELDAVNPPQYTQISDQMRITVVRIRQIEECENRVIPFQRQTVPSESVPPGEEQLIQPGVNGEEQICYRVEMRDGVAGQRIVSGEPRVIREPTDERIAFGPTTMLDPVEITGTVVYISDQNAWVMSGNSNDRRPVTNTGDLDGKVFSLSPDGRSLIYTRSLTRDGSFSNELWLVPDVRAAQPSPVQLRPSNILYAEWVPGQPNTISYSRAEPRQTNPGYSAFNDLWLTTIDPQNGAEISIEPIIEERTSGGLYGWWGTEFKWSPDGQALAYIHADAVGTVNLETGALTPLLRYEVYAPLGDWSWRSSVSWSPDANLIATTVHGPPIGDERPDRSPVFNIAVASTNGAFQADLIERAGMWSLPQFSPLLPNSGTFPAGYLAYLLARQPLNSINDTAEYDLYIADRDGSNARRVFPPENQRGMTSREYTWGPDGRALVVVYQGNLWLIDAQTAIARQLTLDGQASRPVWAR
jgi:resuscitation-promoting factor RpfB